MRIAIYGFDLRDRHDIKMYANDYCNRQGNAHLGAEPKRDDIRAFFARLRRYIRRDNDLDMALNRIDQEFQNMDDM